MTNEEDFVIEDGSSSFSSIGYDNPFEQIMLLKQQVMALQEQVDQLLKRDSVVAADRSKIWKSLNAATEASRADRQRLWKVLQDAINASRGDRGRIWNALHQGSMECKTDREHLWNVLRVE